MQTLKQNINQLNSDVQKMKTAIVHSGVEVADDTPTAEYGEKIGEVFEAGKDAERNEFMDGFQRNGERATYLNTFGLWTNDIFKRLKYDIRPTGNATSAFSGTLIEGSLVELLHECNNGNGIELDLSLSPNTETLFNGARTVTHIGVLDISSSTTIKWGFNNCLKLHTIDLLRVREDGKTATGGAFLYCHALVNIKVDGVFGNGEVALAQSKLLSKESIISIFNALSTTTTGLTATFSKTAVNNAFGIDVDDPTTYPEGSEWYELRNSKSNWTISFA